MIAFMLNGMWQALACALRRRQDGVGPGVNAFRTPPPSVTIIVLVLTIGAAEVVVVELFVPWAWLRWPLLLLAIWALLLIVAAVVVGTTHPHLLTPDALVLRLYARPVARIPRGAVASATLATTRDAAAPGLAGGRLHLPGPSGQTSVRLDLSSAVHASLSARHNGEARQVTLDVTTPRTLVGELTAPSPGAQRASTAT